MLLTFLSRLSGPSTRISPTVTSEVKDVPLPSTVAEPEVIARVPVRVELKAFAPAHVETFNELPRAPGHLAAKGPTPERPLDQLS